MQPEHPIENHKMGLVSVEIGKAQASERGIKRKDFDDDTQRFVELV